MDTPLLTLNSTTTPKLLWNDLIAWYPCNYGNFGYHHRPRTMESLYSTSIHRSFLVILKMTLNNPHSRPTLSLFSSSLVTLLMFIHLTHRTVKLFNLNTPTISKILPTLWVLQKKPNTMSMFLVRSRIWKYATHLHPMWPTSNLLSSSLMNFTWFRSRAFLSCLGELVKFLIHVFVP